MPFIKSFFQFFTFSCFIIAVSNCNPPPKEKLLILQNNSITLKLDPETGGRIASLQYKGVEVLSQIKDENNWAWGSTVWPAPQSDWNWPPPEKMDKGPYEIKTYKPKVIILKSPKNAYKNIQVEKRFLLLDENKIEMKYSFFNWGDTTIQVGIWENTRVPYEGQVHWKTGTQLEEDITGLTQGDSLSVLNLKNHKEPHKLFINSEGGWITHRRKDVVLKKSFEGISKDRIPPGQAQIEIYYDPVKKFAELEEHGPYMMLDHRTVTEFKVIWTLKKK